MRNAIEYVMNGSVEFLVLCFARDLPFRLLAHNGLNARRGCALKKEISRSCIQSHQSVTAVWGWLGKDVCGHLLLNDGSAPQLSEAI
jgi:hypothetical protein